MASLSILAIILTKRLYDFKKTKTVEKNITDHVSFCMSGLIQMLNRSEIGFILISSRD